MNETYVIVAYYHGDGGNPDVDFASTADSAINMTAYHSGNGKQVTVYKITDDGAKLVTGKDLRAIGENKNVKSN